MLIVDHNLQPNKDHREIGICAFGLSAYENAQLSHDPTLFVNDTSEVSFMQKCCKECKLELNDIPLSCMQFAMCNPMVIYQSLSTEISQRRVSLHSVKGQIHKRQAELVKTLTAKMKGELDKKCKEKIREYQFHKLIPLIYEIDFIKLSNKTIGLLKNGNANSWREIDHLQFLIAVLRGHWGKNRLAVIKEWAAFHLMEMMSDLEINPQDEFSLHKYKLCCMCYVLLCDDHFVSIAKPDDSFGILAWRTVNLTSPPVFVRLAMPALQQEPITDVSFICVTPVSQCFEEIQFTIHFLPLSGKFLDDDDELSWTQLYRHCKIIPDCEELYNHERQTWIIGNRTAHGEIDDQYNYKRNDFRLAVGALSDYAKTDNIKQQIQAIQRQMQPIQAIMQEQIQRIQEIMEAQIQAR